jgi:1-deoxy-D-xylulose-5-phosphate reductoisomerase
LKINKIVLTDTESKIKHIDYEVSLYRGRTELVELIKNEDYDILINAISGSAGLPYTIVTLKRGKTLALANKESLVMAGHIVKDIMQETGAQIVPIDSEHSAIFQVLHHRDINEVRNLHITASGGPFRTLPLHEFDNVNLAQTLKHPVWEMGTKVTIDSATMMNKGLEVIEAHWLFDIDYHNIKAVIHPQSIIHSIVEFIDGSMISQMSSPTMQLPILYALSFPQRIQSYKVQTELTALDAMTFEAICKKRYPLFYIACQAGRAGGLMPTILNAANEKAIEMFICGQIKFTSIQAVIEKALNKTVNVQNPDLETIMNISNQIKSHTNMKYDF